MMGGGGAQRLHMGPGGAFTGHWVCKGEAPCAGSVLVTKGEFGSKMQNTQEIKEHVF